MSQPAPTDRFQPFPGAALNRCGLNRQHVFNLADLPPAVIATLGDTAPFRQLILIGHGSVFVLCLGFDAAWTEHSKVLAKGRADLC